MGKVTDKGLIPAEDPMFSNGPQIISPLKSKRSKHSSQDAKAEETQNESPHPMQAAADALERSMAARILKIARESRSSSTESVSPMPEAIEQDTLIAFRERICLTPFLTRRPRKNGFLDDDPLVLQLPQNGSKDADD